MTKKLNTKTRPNVTSERLAENILTLWVEMHRYSYAGLNDEFPKGKIFAAEYKVKLKLQMLLGGGIFELCRRVKQASGKSLSKSYHMTKLSLSKKESLELLLCAIQDTSDTQLFHLLGSSISAFSRLMKNIRDAIYKEPNSQVRGALWNSHKQVRTCYWKLLDTWAFRDMPNTKRFSRLGTLSAYKLAVVLENEYRIISVMAKSNDLPEKYAHKLSQLTGLAIFQGIREQENSRIPDGTTSLVEWLIRPKSRFNRGFFADFAVALHEFAGLQKKLRLELMHPEDFSKFSFRKLQSAEEVVEIFMHKVLATGILENMPH